MKAALAVALAGLVGCATTPGAPGRYALSDNLQLQLDAHSRAASLPPLDGAGDDELRVWTHAVMTGDVEGFVVSSNNTTRCRTTYDYADGIVSMHAARCRRGNVVEAALEALDDLAALDGKEWDCEVEDGIQVLIEGVLDGKRFAFNVGNPGFCTDPGSKAVANLLHDLAK